MRKSIPNEGKYRPAYPLDFIDRGRIFERVSCFHRDELDIHGTGVIRLSGL